MVARSTFAGLNTMYRGVSTNRMALETTGHNMTNSNVEGYSRQSVHQIATRADEVYANGTKQFIGSGVDSQSITRARDVYADKQYWREYSDQEYAKTRQTNYQKLEAIFNDSDDTGLQNALLSFYQSWVDMSKEASNTSARVAVVEEAGILVDRIKASSKQLQDQIISEYDDIKINVAKVNTITEQIVQLNKAIMAAESTGGSANDLRDQRDNLADQLSGFMSVSVFENEENSMYTIVSNGTSIVNGITKLDLTVGPVYEDGSQPGIPNSKYGITDYNIEIGDTGVVFDPLTGRLKGEMDAIKEDKGYIDDIARMAAFLMTEFNAQHKLGAGMDIYEPDKDAAPPSDFPTTGINFFGENDPNLYCMLTPTDHNGIAYIWDEASQTMGVYCQQQDVVYDSTEKQWKVNITINENGTAEVTSKDSAGKVIKLTGGWAYLDGINIIEALKVSSTITEVDGERKIAARTLYETDEDPNTATKSHLDMLKMYMTKGGSASYYVGEKGVGDKDGTINGTADGSNAVLLSTLLNLEYKERIEDSSYKNLAAVGASSLQNFYNKEMTNLGVNSSQMNNKVKSQEDIVEQVMQWRTSVAGVNWDEELTNMIMFQQGYAACSRCLTTMDEMLDRLINSTGVVGR